jgi:general secretion pathway protein F
MGAFEYVVLDEKGRERKGVAEGDTAKQVRQNLREKGLIPLQINVASQKESSAAEKGKFSSSRLFQRGISTTELALITRQMATLVQAALPLDEALAAVAKQSEKQRIRSMMYAVRAKVMEGHTLAAGLGEYPKVFSDLYCATVDAGEKSGHRARTTGRLHRKPAGAARQGKAGSDLPRFSDRVCHCHRYFPDDQYRTSGRIRI